MTEMWLQKYKGDLFDSATPSKAPDADSLTHAREAILDALLDGPQSCRTIDRLTKARGQAVIGQLRKDGYQIATEWYKGERCYSWGGERRGTVRLGKSDMEAYLASSHWRTIRASRLKLDGYACCLCKSPKDLEVHHWAYSLFDEDVTLDLMTLCRRCHEMMHDRIKGSSVHFPHDTIPEVKARIKTGARNKWTAPARAPRRLV